MGNTGADIANYKLIIITKMPEDVGRRKIPLHWGMAHSAVARFVWRQLGELPLNITMEIATLMMKLN